MKMCIPVHQLDPKARRLRRIANICLVVGLLLWNSYQWKWFHLSAPIERNLLHATVGLMMGISIGINLFGLRLARRCRAAETS
jgi:hypothetical protein